MVSFYEKLLSIKGIGEKKAKELINAKINTMEKLILYANNSDLPIEAKVFILYKPENKIKYNIATEIIKTLSKYLNDFTIAGSYRRKKQIISDIDVITFDNIQSVINKLKPLNPIIYKQGEEKTSLLIKYSNKFYKLDIMKTTKKEYPFFLLYLTGSKEFNIQMRHIAKLKGYLLNQKGLYKNNKKINLKSEEEIFKYLNMSYLAPEKR